MAKNENFGPILWADGSSDVEPEGGGVIVIGQHDDYNLAMDRNEIAARMNGNVSQLLLNFDGGDTIVGGRLAIGAEPQFAQLSVIDSDPGAAFGIFAQTSQSLFPAIFAENTNPLGAALWADSPSDLSLSGGGIAVFGQITERNVSIDRNEIMARDDGPSCSVVH